MSGLKAGHGSPGGARHTGRRYTETSMIFRGTICFAGGLGAAVLLFVVSASVSPLQAADSSPEDLEFFEKEIRPVLAEQCYVCHGPQLQQKGLRLDSREAILTGGSRGPAIIPGDAESSLLARVVRHEGFAMPPGRRLDGGQIAALEKWISIGAPWPAEKEQPLGSGDPDFYEQITREHWAFQPVKRVTPPRQDTSAKAHSPVDRFIRRKLAEAELLPAPAADPATLLRRVSFVLTGLPPSPEQLARFAADPSPGGYERAVDELLASAHFGEHWARHWMDVVRFAETFGNDWNYELNGASHYRDYLIRAFNQDVPYDQLVREHVAGDLLDEPRINEQEGINESLAGLNFYRLGEQGHDDCILFREVRTDVVDDQIDVLGKAFQGLTIACARCHDHKLDPIPTKDYYGLYSVLSSSRLVTRTLDTRELNEDRREKLRQLKPKIRDTLASLWSERNSQMATRLSEAYVAWRDRPRPDPEEEEAEEGKSADANGKPAEAESVDNDADAETENADADKPGDKDAKDGKKEDAPAPVLFAREKITWDDPLYLWVELTRLAEEGAEDFAENWKSLTARYHKESASRVEFNRVYFEDFADFRDSALDDWSGEGQGLTDAASPAGEFTIAPEGPHVLSGVFPAGLYTHALSEKFNAAIRSPFVPQDKLFVSMQVMGGKLGAWRATLDNCMLAEDYKPIDNNNLEWIRIPTRFERHSYPFYVEMATRHDNPRFPDRPDRMEGLDLSLLDQPRSYFGIARVVVHDCEAVPENELTHLKRLFDGLSPKSFEELAQRFAAEGAKAIEAWAAGRATDGDARWVDWLVDNELVANSVHVDRRLADLVGLYRAVESDVPEPRVVYGMADVEEGRDYPIMKRGNPKNLGEPAPRGFLQLITKAPNGFDVERSGRREIAEAIADSENPLTARVMANRIWHYVFGRGIVATVNNFGRVGEKPTHPELLDHLARQFIEQGWSIKQLIRELVLTETFRQSSTISEEGTARDPSNQLLHRYPVRRLDAELVRDAILRTAGTLDPTLYGKSIHPHRKDPQEYRKLYSGPLDGGGRRSIYIKVTRHEGDRFLELFDFPNPGVSRGRRDVTNIPGQSLALLNHPFVIEQAGFWADRVMADSEMDVERRIADMFETALARRPDAVELTRLRGLAAEIGSLHGVNREELLKSRAVWKDIAHALFNLKEFIYLR